MARNNGYTYIVHATGTDLYKIGSSTDVRRRISGLQSGSANLLEIVTVVEGTDVERILHDIFADYRRHGEWFELDNPLLVLIVRTAAHQQSRWRTRRTHLRAVS